jgi:hypothetical protein
MAGDLSSRWNPVRFQVNRRCSAETSAGTVATLPIGFAEMDGSLLIMTKERVRVRVADGEIERLLEAGDMRKL